MSRVVHCNHATYDVLIDRSTSWGSPFYPGVDGDRAMVLVKYEAWLKAQPNLMKRLPELRGKVLGCWCHPQLCHGDVLERLANAVPE